ncbi:unnamed protein product, partial [Ectocarpus sp. 6 AP-2014]
IVQRARGSSIKRLLVRFEVFSSMGRPPPRSKHVRLPAGGSRPHPFSQYCEQ